MKKYCMLLSLFMFGTVYAAPVVVTPLPLPANYSSDLVLTNVLSTATPCALRITPTPGSIFNVSGSTLTVSLAPGTSVFANVNLGTMTVTLLPGTTVFVTPAAGASFTVSGSTVNVGNLSDIQVSGSTVSVVDRYYQKISSGTSGLLTGVTTAVIVVTEPVSGWSFKHRNLIATESIATINQDLYGTNISLFDGDADSEAVDVARAVTFNISMPVTSTLTYVINTLK
jgi:hypothetical protein